MDSFIAALLPNFIVEFVLAALFVIFIHIEIQRAMLNFFYIMSHNV